MTLSEFKTRLGKLPATKGTDASRLDTYIEKALLAFSEYNAEQVLMKKVPVTVESNGFYDVPSDARSIFNVFVHNTDSAIEFSVERDASTGVEKLRLGPIARPSTFYIEGNFNEMANLGTSDPRLRPHGGVGVTPGYSYFDIAYFRAPDLENLGTEIERLGRRDLSTIEYYVEYLGYLDTASDADNLVDITDEAGGNTTTVRRSNIGRQNVNLAQLKKDEFEARVIRPYAARDTIYAYEYFYGDARI